jgi:hypothetical protein
MNWTTLDTRLNETFTVGQKRSFTFTNTTTWECVRLNVTANNGGGVIDITELEFRD